MFYGKIVGNKMKKIFFSLWVFISLTAISCKDTIEDVHFMEFKNVELGAKSVNDFVIKGDCMLYNPNSFSVELSQASLDVFINDRKAGSISQTLNAQMESSSTFALPVEIKVQAADFYGKNGSGALSTAVDMFLTKKARVTYSGSVIASKGVFNMQVPVMDSLVAPIKF